ncbi:MAG TPA: polyphenol oxidase family protein [Gemmatimonadaceae bacterium]|nr:polyphenol oxidase family protein [Gemmatimonadaceae bacterium]
MMFPEQAEVVDDFARFGIFAFTTTRQFGSVGTGSDEPVRDVLGRWDAIRATLDQRGVKRLATASQVHGAHVLIHEPGWEGWLRSVGADGHLAVARGTALGVTIADCVPVFLAHPSGSVAALHSGWRGTVARIAEHGIRAMEQRGFPANELYMHLGPAICARCYEVSADVAAQLTGEAASAARTVDLRGIIAEHARALGVHHISVSPSCTKCDNNRFFSHRAGDAGRQVAVIMAS